MALKASIEKEAYEGLSSDLQAEYKEKDGKYVLDTPEGFKPLTEFNTVHGALQKERKDHSATKTKLTAFGDLNPEEVRGQLERIPELELAAEGNVDEKKIDKIVETRIKSRLAPVERERDTLKTQVVEKDKAIEGYVSKERTRKIHDAVSTEARKAKIVDTALDDVLLLAERVLEVTEDGRVATKDNVGVTPGLDITGWLSDLQPKRPHWWPSSSGGGGRAGDQGNIGDNPWRPDQWNMTKQAQIVAADRAKAERMAKAAGSKIGALTKPEKK